MAKPLEINTVNNRWLVEWPNEDTPVTDDDVYEAFRNFGLEMWDNPDSKDEITDTQRLEFMYTHQGNIAHDYASYDRKYWVRSKGEMENFPKASTWREAIDAGIDYINKKYAYITDRYAKTDKKSD